MDEQTTAAYKEVRKAILGNGEKLSRAQYQAYLEEIQADVEGWLMANEEEMGREEG